MTKNEIKSVTGTQNQVFISLSDTEIPIYYSGNLWGKLIISYEGIKGNIKKINIIPEI